MSIYFRIEGKPTPKQSTRFTGFRAFTPKKIKEYAEKVRHSFLMNNIYWSYQSIIENPVKVKIDVFVSIPKKFNKKLKQSALEQKIKPVIRPDVDNIAKGILDPLNGLVWADDRQVYFLSIEKHYAESDYITVEIDEVTND